MKNSIEYIFTSLAHFFEKEKPLSGHKQRFLSKLEDQNKTHKFPVFKTYYMVAAALLALVSFAAGSQFFFHKTNPANDYEKATVYFTEYINQQLVEIEQDENAEYSNLIKDSKKQLALLEIEYQKLMSEFKTNTVHPLLVQAMIENLQHRSIVLQELEEQINTLKNTNYEKEIL